MRADLAAGAPQKAHVESLITLLIESRARIVRRLAELNHPCPVRVDSRAPFASRPVAASGSKRALENASRRSARMCVKACRACGRALVRAFREAQRAADSATANVLYGSMREVEKQLWVVDPLHIR